RRYPQLTRHIGPLTLLSGLHSATSFAGHIGQTTDAFTNAAHRATPGVEYRGFYFRNGFLLCENMQLSPPR
ncbi:hypothetical protein, partial [Serratia marcescens]|uniref:hypothetical protein n=1 Tax=Serratia marcescens TaxID=615 RepID=UPI002813C4CA